MSNLTRALSSRQIRVGIVLAFPQAFQRFALAHVNGKTIKIAKPTLAVLPGNMPRTFHAAKLHSGSGWSKARFNGSIFPNNSSDKFRSRVSYDSVTPEVGRPFSPAPDHWQGFCE